MGTKGKNRSGSTEVVPGQLRVSPPTAARDTGREAGVRSAPDDESFRRAVESFLDAFAIYAPVRDPEGGIVDFRVEYANQAACELTGRERADYVGRTVLELYPGLEGTECFEWYVDAVENGCSTTREGVAFDTTAHGREGGRYFDLRVAPLGDGCTASWRDVTERKCAELALLRDKELTGALNRINQALHSSLDMDEVIRRVVAEGAAALGSETAAITLRDDDGFVVEHVHGMASELRGLRLKDGEQPHALLALSSRQPVAVVDALNDERVDREHLAQYNIRSVLVAPLILRDRPFGAIFFNYHAGPHAFTDSEVSFARQLAATASIALENARLFEEQERSEQDLRAAKEELEQKVAERTAELARQAGQLRALASELTLAEQRERRRLAEVLHDDLQQLLAGAKFHLHGLRHTRDETVKGIGADVEGLLDDALERCRTLTWELSPPILHQAGLVAALEWLVTWKHDKHGLRVDLEAAPEAAPESEDVTVLLFQAARELLFNVVEHAGVMEARVRLRRLNDHVELEVSDQGAGFDPAGIVDREGPPAGFGLLSIRERLVLLGGQLAIDSAPGRGSRITLLAPVATRKGPGRAG